MREAKLVKIVSASLSRQFGKACYLNKNHGSQFTVAGRPDIEGNLFGRHFGLELKSGSRFSDNQISHLKKIAEAGGIAGGIVYHDGTVYYLTVNQVANYSLRSRHKWTKVPMDRYLDFNFIYKYLNIFYLYYHEEHDVLSED
jgi:penicillin-binding protein-related factor A (putative recombinase)